MPNHALRWLKVSEAAPASKQTPGLLLEITRTPDPKRCSNRFNRFKLKIRFSVLNLGTTNNISPELALGRRPIAKSGETFFVVPQVSPLLKCEVTLFSPARCTFSDPESAVQQVQQYSILHFNLSSNL